VCVCVCVAKYVRITHMITPKIHGRDVRLRAHSFRYGLDTLETQVLTTEEQLLLLGLSLPHRTDRHIDLLSLYTSLRWCWCVSLQCTFTPIFFWYFLSTTWSPDVGICGPTDWLVV